MMKRTKKKQQTLPIMNVRKFMETCVTAYHSHLRDWVSVMPSYELRKWMHPSDVDFLERKRYA